MEDSEMSDEWAENRNVLYFFRNVLSPALAELFVRELKNSEYIKRSLENDRNGTSNDDLFTLLKKVDSDGRKNEKNEAKRRKNKEEKIAGASDTTNTQHLNNIKDENNKDILSKVKVHMLLQESETNKAIGELWKLDAALLLCILTNDVLQFQFPHEFKVKQSLDALKKIRNSFRHRDDHSSSSSSRQAQMMDELAQNLRHETKALCTYLGKDITSFQEYSVSQPQMTSQSPVLKEVQQEIYKHYKDHILKKHHNHTIQLNIKHLRGHSQPDDFVENLKEFLLKNQASEGQEPRPVLLSGVPGAGKSFILNSLAFSVICEQQSSGDYFLVMLLDEAAVRNKTREIFWEQLLCHLADLSPQAVQKHGREEILKVLSSYTSHFLFLMDQNLQNTKYLNNLMPCMDRGTWVLSYQGEPETSTFFHVLKVTSLSEEQVHQVLKDIVTAEQYKQMSEFYKRCDYKGLINTPDMVHIFTEVCLEMRECVPFYTLIKLYIYKKIHKTEENEKELIKLGKKAFDTIKHNGKYYREMTDLKSNIFHPFLDHDRSKGYYFKYRVVEDYLAAMYVVKDTVVACESWLMQATLFKRVFEIACALWSEHQEDISANMHFITSYLETLFDIANPQKTKTKKQKQKQKAAMETDQAKGPVTSNFARWIFVSKMVKENQNHTDILPLLANLLARKHTWHFKCKLLTENAIDNISLVLRHIKLNDKLIIKVESGPNVTILTKLWSMLSSHKKVWSNTSVQLVIHHTEGNWVMHENLIAKLLAKIAETKVSLYITKYVGPLLCSGTPQFLQCSCLKELDVLDVYVCDQNSLCQVLAHQKLGSAIVRLHLKVSEQMVPSTSTINLSSSLPLTLIIFYFEGLQKLLDRFEPPDNLYSLRIYRVYIHKKFTLNLRRFSKLKFLSIRFLHLGKMPLKYLKLAQSEDRMEVDYQENDRETSQLPLHQWTLHLALHLYLPVYLERLLMRNLLFCDDSNILILSRYWNKLPFQRLVLLDTRISILKFREILQSLGIDPQIEDMRMAIEKKCRLEEFPASLPKSVIKRERLKKEEREKRRKKKPDGKELIVISEAELCKKCYLSCTCVQESINHSRATYTDFATLVKVVYQSDFLSINYSGEGITVRKDMCGDLYVQCPLPFLNDEMAWKLEGHSELGQVMEALALAQAIYLNHTCLSHAGAMYLLKHLKAKKKNFGKIEPFRLTIFSCFNHICSKSAEEVQHSHFMKNIKEDDSLQQFNFRCECMERCHNFKKSIEGKIYFNNKVLNDR